MINPTEALVSIDINSGRSTREHNIEQTALNTNLEAANEIARQLRLRDMAGLVVIDFIDMEHGSNVRKVEKAMKEALKNDRARIQVGRISSFGLFEMSRQRLRTGVLEASTRQCPHCEGTGLVRTASSAGLSALRMLEDEAARGRGSRLALRLSQEAAFYLLNRKRPELAEIENRYGVSIEVLPDGTLEGARMSVEASGPPPAYAPRIEPVLIEAEDDDVLEIEDEDEEAEESEAEPEGDAEHEQSDARRRRRRRRRRGRGRDGEAQDPAAPQAGETEEEPIEARADEAQDSSAESEARRKRNRRGRRGGRRHGNGTEPVVAQGQDVTSEDAAAAPEQPVATAEIAEAPALPQAEPEAPAAEAKPRRRPRARKATEANGTEEITAPSLAEATDAPKPRAARRKKAESAEAETQADGEAEAPAKPKRTRARKVAPAPLEATPEAVNDEAPEAEPEAVGAPRRGWWQRTFGE